MYMFRKVCNEMLISESFKKIVEIGLIFIVSCMLDTCNQCSQIRSISSFNLSKHLLCIYSLFYQPKIEPIFFYNYLPFQRSINCISRRSFSCPCHSIINIEHTHMMTHITYELHNLCIPTHIFT